MIIGIDGDAGAGKDTIADVLVKVGFMKVSFADPLRESLVHSTGFQMTTFIDRDIKDKLFDEPYILTSTVIIKFCEYLGYPEKAQTVVDKYSGMEIISPRHLMQFMGTEVGRAELSPTIWLDKYQEKVQTLGLVVTPDCRFSNERELVRTLKGLVWIVKREGLESVKTHKSELEKWPDSEYDMVIQNKGLNQLRGDIAMWWSLKGHKL